MRYNTDEVQWILKDLSAAKRKEILSILELKNKTKVMNVLTEYLNQSNAELVGVTIMLLEELFDKCSKEVRLKIADKLTHKDEWVRERATDALKKLGNKDVVDYLLEALNDSDDMVRSYASEAIGRWGDERALPQLRKMLLDKDGLVRASAVEALGNIGDTSVIPTLRKMKRMDKDQLVQECVQEALDDLRELRERGKGVNSGNASVLYPTYSMWDKRKKKVEKNSRAYILPYREWRRLYGRAYRAQQRNNLEVCGYLVVGKDRRIELHFVKNASDRPGNFVIDEYETRTVRNNIKGKDKRMLGMFHSHPLGDAVPRHGDLRNSFYNGYSLIYDVSGYDARLWRLLKNGGRNKLKEVPLILERRNQNK